MILHYTTKNNGRVAVNADNLFSKDCESVKVHAIYENGIGRMAKKQVITEANGVRYFMWNNERVYLGQYETFKLQELIALAEIKGNIPPVYAYSTIMRYADDIGFIINPTPYATVNAQTENEYAQNTKMLFVPTDRNNPKNNWNKVIVLTPNNKEHWKYVWDISIPLEAFLDMIKEGKVTIVEKSSFIHQYNKKETSFNNLSAFKKKRYIKKFGAPEKVML